MKSATIKELREKFNPIMRRHLKNKYNPSYGLEVLHLLLKSDNYLYCSFSNKSIPTAGSHTLRIEQCNQPHPQEVKKVTIHKDFSVTLFTEKGNIKYTK